MLKARDAVRKQRFEIRNFVGAVAQLGERLVCNQEVVGSNPIGSTKNVRLCRPTVRGRSPEHRRSSACDRQGCRVP